MYDRVGVDKKENINVHTHDSSCWNISYNTKKCDENF
jgi:hypothetical protein